MKSQIDSISLSSIYKRNKSDRDIFQELMPTKVKEILLLATLYDSYSIVREGQFTDIRDSPVSILKKMHSEWLRPANSTWQSSWSG
jgi:hypothetical protein